MQQKRTHRRALFACALLILLALPLAVLAQPQPLAYVYDDVTRTLVAVYADGGQQAQTLPMPADAYASVYDMSFSADGGRLAYCPIQYGAVSADGTLSAPPAARLIVRDLGAGSERLNLDLGAAMGCRPFYRSDGAFLAVGIVRGLPGEIAANPTRPSWELVIVDSAGGGQLAALNALSPQAAALTPLTSGTLMPYVRRFDGTQVTFSALPYAVGGMASVPGFLWSIDAGTLAPADPWGSMALDWLPATGELAWLAEDPSRPSAEPSGPLPRYNVVRFQDASGQRVIYSVADWTLIDARFIDDGARLAVQMMAPANPDRPPEAPIPARWVAIDRAGQVAELQTIEGYSQLRSAPGGYVLLQGSRAGDGSSAYTLDFVNAADGAITTLWAQTAAADQPSAWELAWTLPSSAQNVLPAFAGQ